MRRMTLVGIAVVALGLVGLVAYGLYDWLSGDNGSEQVAQLEPADDTSDDGEEQGDNEPPVPPSAPAPSKVAGLTSVDMGALKAHVTSEIDRGVDLVTDHMISETNRGADAVNSHTTTEVNRGVKAVNSHTTTKTGQVLAKVIECCCDDDDCGNCPPGTKRQMPAVTKAPPSGDDGDGDGDGEQQVAEDPSEDEPAPSKTSGRTRVASADPQGCVRVVHLRHSTLVCPSRR